MRLQALHAVGKANASSQTTNQHASVRTITAVLHASSTALDSTSQVASVVAKENVSLWKILLPTSLLLHVNVSQASLVDHVAFDALWTL